MTTPARPSPALQRILALREALTPSQERLLNHIWTIRLDSRRFEWPAAISVNLELDLTDTKAALELAPAGTLFVIQTLPEQFGLTLLGVLLTPNGERHLDLLEAYIQYICSKAKANPQLPDNTRQEVAAALQLDANDASLLGQLIYLSGLHGRTMNLGNDWSCGFPADIARLRFELHLREHIAEIAVSQAARAVAQSPSQLIPQMKVPAPTHKRESFLFMSNPALRASAKTDWLEAKQARKAGSWRSCVIACGAILEGMLLDAVERDTSRAREALARVSPSHSKLALRRWGLYELASVCRELGILGDQSLHLTHALRFSRDLVHPGRAMRLRASIGKAEAIIALATVKHVHSALRARSGDDGNTLADMATSPPLPS